MVPVIGTSGLGLAAAHGWSSPVVQAMLRIHRATPSTLLLRNDVMIILYSSTKDSENVRDVELGSSRQGLSIDVMSFQVVRSVRCRPLR
jgi:hypothetical protein